MNIYNILGQNLSQKSRTLKPDDSVPYPKNFRGRLLHQVDLCTACGTCVYSCSPGAIQITQIAEDRTQWKYTEDRCTFCGFCVQYCPTHALDFAEESPEPMTERVQHYTLHEIPMIACSECGKAVHVVPLPVLEQIYGSPLPADILQAQHLCEDCRQELTSERFMNTVVVKGDRKND